MSKMFFITFKKQGNGGKMYNDFDLCLAEDEAHAQQKEMDKSIKMHLSTSDYVVYDLQKLLDKYKLKITKNTEETLIKPIIKEDINNDTNNTE